MADSQLDPGKIKKATTNEEIVALLKDDMKGEHAAIIQYLQHAYKVGEGEVGSEVEGIARDEMRHFRWLGELIVELGGDPTMERDPIFLDTPEDFQLMLLDIEAEDRAIEQYEAHLEAIDHPKARRIIERILVDERTHKAMFRDYVKELGGDPNQKINPPVGPWQQGGDAPAKDLEIDEQGQTKPADLEADDRDDHPLVRLLNNRVRQEYMTILSYLHRAFISWNSNPALSRSLIEDRAIWHMTHMGHVGEAVAGLGETPEMVFSDLPMTNPAIKDQQFNQWGKQNESQLAENSLQLIKTIKEGEKGGNSNGEENEELEDLERQLKRMVKHDQFMQAQFEDDLNH